MRHAAAVAGGFLAVLAAVLVSAHTPGPIPQKRVEGVRGVTVYNDGGSYGLTSSTAGEATTADWVLYVDPLGSDSNACTASGASACLTIQAALNKAPKVLRHRLTVNVAAGNHAGFTLSGFTLDPAFQKTTSGILIDGVLGNVTPTTGTATGTATSGTAGSGVTFGTLTDTGQGWTVNDLRGKFVVITGGTGSGQTRVVAANTATAITIAGTWTSPNATSTYAIQEPSAAVTSPTAAILTALGASSVASAGIQVVNNNLGGVGTSQGQVTIRNLGVSTTGSFVHGVSVLGGGVNLLQVRAAATGSGSTGLLSSGGAFVTADVSSITGSSSGFGAQATSGQVVLNRSYAASNAAVTASAREGRSVVNVLSSYLVATGTTPACVFAISTGMVTLVSTRCDCESAAGSYGVIAGANAVTAPTAPGWVSVTTGIDVTNCTTGVLAGPGSAVTFAQTTTYSGNSLSYSAASRLGGMVSLPASISITSGTADLSLDDAASTAAFGSLAAAYSCLTSATTGSRVCRL